MHLWGGVREVLGVHGVLERNRSKLKEGTSHTRDGVTQDHERGLEAIGRIATLNRFVLKATDKCLPFFKTLK